MPNLPRKNLNVNYRLTASGFNLKIFGKSRYAVKYPSNIFRAAPRAVKSFILDNFIYARTRPLTFYVKNHLTYQTKTPFLKSFIDWGILNDLPCIAELNHLPTSRLKKDFLESESRIAFSPGQTIKRLPDLKNSPRRAVLSISFGKDSLLSYGLAKEIGLRCLLATANEIENFSGNEWRFKKEIIQSFIKEQRQPVNVFYDNVDEIFYHPKLGKKLEEMDDTNSLLAYTLELLPFVYFWRASYLIFGNEHNLNDSFKNHDGLKSYPSFDQSSVYTQKENQRFNRLTSGRLKVISLIEPLYNLAEFKILYHRYPHLLKYMMSCMPGKNAKERWCYDCPACVKAFLYSAAVGGDPKKIMFTKKMLGKGQREFYPLFAHKIDRHFEMPPLVKEEQLLSFLLLWRLGYRGYLMDLFEKKYLTEAQRKEKALRKRFFGIHPAINLPLTLKSKVLKIYRQELSALK